MPVPATKYATNVGPALLDIRGRAHLLILGSHAVVLRANRREHDEDTDGRDRQFQYRPAAPAP